jgi:hypothetical protein
MGYDMRGVPLLDKIADLNNVAANGGTKSKTYVIPAGVRWCITFFGARTSCAAAKVEFLFSADGGQTFLNPFDGTENDLRVLFVSKDGGDVASLDNAMYFDGDGVNTVIKIKATNNDTSAAEIVGSFNGWIE